MTRDGIAIDLLINAGLAMDLAQIAHAGALGIGLFRTELQFMVASKFPRPGEQEAFYREILREAGDHPVTFRLLDIGGDKMLPYGKHVPEENPALGWRAIRLTLDRPGLIRGQVRALLKAAAGRELRVMAPMVTELREITQIKSIINHEIELLTRFGHDLPRRFRFGAMIEVPSLLWQLDELLREVDFVSVGSNDLFQFTMATDRSNSRIANRFDPLSRTFLRVLRDIVRKADQAGKPVTLCGEMAGKPLSAMALIAIGYRAISMAPSAIGPVKSMIRQLDAGRLAETLLPEIDRPATGRTLRELLGEFAERHAIQS